MTDRAQEIGQQLLERYVAGDLLSVEELVALVDAYWRPGDLVTDVLPKALDEPPVAPSAAPVLFAGVLMRIRERILGGGNPSPRNQDTLNDVRERLALVIAANDNMAREFRLKSALTTVMEVSAFEDEARSVSVRLMAELGYRLVTEFAQTSVIPLCASSFWLLDTLDRSADGLRELALCYEMKLRGLVALKKRGGQPETLFDTEWQRVQQEAATDVTAERPTDELNDQQLWRIRARTALLSVVTNRGADLDSAVSEAIRQWQLVGRKVSAWDADSEDRSNSKLALRGLERLTLGVLNLLRMRAAAGIVGVPTGHAALFELLRELRSRHYLDAEKQRIFQELGGLTGATDTQTMGKALLGAKGEIDAVALRQHIDEMLNEVGSERRGLAMSGGGFRAAFFHMGVLAWLAESDQLRRLDVISCVSGGSIAGACFAVRLKTLLLGKHDLEVQRGDYIQVVADAIESLSAVGRSNLRMRAFASPVAVLRMWLQPGYTLTERIAELLDRDLFAPLHSYASKLSRKELRRLSRTKSQMTRPGLWGSLAQLTAAKAPQGWPIGPWDLKYTPRGEAPEFLALAANTVRRAKVPEIAFNSTTVNTGSAFRFTAAAHGERTYPEAVRISSRPRLSWMSYDDISADIVLEPRLLPLSRVVAASASVPGIIPPLLVGRNTQNVLIALSDGGMVDNQGVDHLLDRRCTHIAVSDAAGQLLYEPFPDVTNLSVVGRSSDILMERVRELNYERLAKAERSGALTEWTSVHLTKELSTPPPQATFRPDDTLENRLHELDQEESTSYGIRKGTQGLLAEIRTDLDCFSSAEAQTLMLSGFRQAKQAMPRSEALADCPAHSWPFLDMSEATRPGGNGVDRLSIVLEGARYRFLRLPRISAALLGLRPKRPGILTAIQWLLVLAIVAWIFVRFLIGSKLVNAVLLLIVVVGLFALHFPQSAFKRWMMQLAVGPLLLLAMLWAWMLLLVGDRLFLRLSQKRQ